ncbi:FAD binding domain protein [Eremomyces bilateralis CBS 781.70]|uniref:FAD binding domain protein n=1 Tax=Eremomyces bilateralis CBS 781.70 TaxID=1392243 RepID=A0A6G1GGV0_9PEZI|nr:FAD binding domain protein [Eremomyces bilateralis CBS 781.70]KAF1817298.1 FAD binding domain protein [Eremomyces bilateralis CBS 781.70]
MRIFPPSGIEMLIVGGGIAGLTLAIESYRKGHKVRVIERRDNFDGLGDIFGISGPAFRSLLNWPGFYDRLLSQALRPEIHFYKYDGSWIYDMPGLEVNGRLLGFMLSRAHMHDCLFEYAKELGIPITFSQQVVEYSEDAERGFIKLSDGSVLSADIIVAADGVGSQSHTLISGRKTQPISSGYALYRATFNLQDALANPAVRAFWGDKPEYVSIFIGPDVHIVMGRNDARNTMCWLLTHKDTDNTSRESWSATTRASNALKFVAPELGWTEHIRALIRSTTNDECIDWRLMWRDPQPVWHSPRGRVIQAGDSCHPFLPSSGSGAVMAMEDAYSLAACLQLAGKEGISLGVRVHNRLRFERVACAQKMGFKARHTWHQGNWDEIHRNPAAVLRTMGKWLFMHDAEGYAYENFGKCLGEILNGARFENTNIPPGYMYKPWTAQELVDKSAAGEDILDEGDWS